MTEYNYKFQIYNCLVCGKKLYSFQHKFCSKKCRRKYYYFKKRKEYNCLVCGKKLLYRRYKFCSKKCGRKEYERKRALERKNNPKKYKKYREGIRKWQLKNQDKCRKSAIKAMKKFIKIKPKRFKELMRKNYQRNKVKYFERNFVNRYRKEILKIIGKKCIICKKPVEHIHHLTYINLPLRRKKNLRKYCEYLIPLCANCHRRGVHNKTANYINKLP